MKNFLLNCPVFDFFSQQDFLVLHWYDQVQSNSFCVSSCERLPNEFTDPISQVCHSCIVNILMGERTWYALKVVFICIFVFTFVAIYDFPLVVL